MFIFGDYLNKIFSYQIPIDNNIDISNDIINLDKDVQAQVDLLNRKETDQNYSNNVELFLVEEDAAKEEVFEQVLLEPIKEEQVALSSVIEEEQVQCKVSTGGFSK